MSVAILIALWAIHFVSTINSLDPYICKDPITVDTPKGHQCPPSPIISSSLKKCKATNKCISKSSKTCPECDPQIPYGCLIRGTTNFFRCCPGSHDQCNSIRTPLPTPLPTPQPVPSPTILPGGCDFNPKIDNGEYAPRCITGPGNGGNMYCPSLDKCILSVRGQCPVCYRPRPFGCEGTGTKSGFACCPTRAQCPGRPPHPAPHPAKPPHPAPHPAYHPSYRCGTNENTGDRRPYLKCNIDIRCCNGYYCQSDGKCKPNNKPPHQCGTNKNTGDRSPQLNCNTDTRCCNGYYCQRGNGKCKPNGKPPRGGGGGHHGRNNAVSNTDNIDESGPEPGSKNGPGSKNAYDEEIEVKAIATFKSGVYGTVQVDENGNIFINLDLNNFDSNCGEYEYGIYNKYDSSCTDDINGGFFNPFGSSVSCDDYNGNGDKYFECSIGDLSARFGNGIVDNNYEIVVEGNISENDNDKPGGFCVSRLTPEALYQRAIVFKCVEVDGDDISFCAPFEITKSGDTGKCKELGETCETAGDCCDSECVDLEGNGSKICYLE